MKNLNAVFLVVLVLFGLSGCASVTGHKFDTSNVSKIVVNKTTKSEIRSMFGAPFSTAESSNGDTWQYIYDEGMNYGEAIAISFGVKSMTYDTQRLTVMFNKSNVVQSYTFNGPTKDSPDADGSQKALTESSTQERVVPKPAQEVAVSQEASAAAKPSVSKKPAKAKKK